MLCICQIRKQLSESLVHVLPLACQLPTAKDWVFFKFKFIYKPNEKQLQESWLLSRFSKMYILKIYDIYLCVDFIIDFAIEYDTF